MRYYLLLSLSLFLVPLRSNCNHIIGGNITYVYLGNNQYRITLEVYRDCNPGMAPFDDPASLSVFNSKGGLIEALSLSSPDIKQINPSTNNPCLQVPPNVCVEEATYTQTVTLDPMPGGYQLVYQRCCRNTTITNIYNPGATGASYVATIPDLSQFGANSSPTFQNYPPVVICRGESLVFDDHANDPDGDELVYSLCTPSQGASQDNPEPQPATDAPPYDSIFWLNPYSVNNQIGGNPPLAIDSKTGMLTGNPTSIGQFVVGVCVEEYRSGQFLSETKRDFQFNVAVCNPIVRANFKTSTGSSDTIISCGQNTIQFLNESIGNKSEVWTFGETASPTDQSTLANPSFTYANTGIYKVSLAVNPGTTCADTATKIVEILKPILTDFSAPANPCAFSLESFKDMSTSPNSKISTWAWSFGDGSGSSVQNPVHNYSTAGNYNIMLFTKDKAGCADTITKEVTVYSPPIPVVSSDTAICNIDSVKLSASGGIAYSWSPDYNIRNPHAASTIAKPTVSTTYTVAIKDNHGCISNDSVIISVVDTVIATAGPDTSICSGNSVQLYARNAVYYKWQPSEELSNSSIANPVAKPLQNTSYTVTSFIGSCFDVKTVIVNVLPLPAAYAGLDVSINQGESTPLNGSGTGNYMWSPNRDISNVQEYNPVVNPLNTTTYVLTVMGQNGCSANDSVVIRVTHIHELFVPNAFSPNKDGINDNFNFFTKGIQKIITVKIYNRWGQSIFESDGNSANEWDGTFNGQPMPVGTYVYLIEAETFDGDIITKKGDLTLLR